MPEIVQQNPVNDRGSKPVHNRSTFKPNYSMFQTNLFGLCTPFFAMAGVDQDEISIRQNVDLDTFSLKAPVMMPIKRNMDYFMMNLRCLLPETAELIITNPLRGDDVNAEKVNSVLNSTRLNTILSNVTSSFTGKVFQQESDVNSVARAGYWLQRLLYYIQTMNKLFSASSLPKQLGYSFDDLIFYKHSTTNEHYTLDEVTEMVMKLIEKVMYHNDTYYSFQVQYAKPIFTLDTYQQPQISGINYEERTYTLDPDLRAKEGYGTLADFLYDLISIDLPINKITWDTDALEGIVYDYDSDNLFERLHPFQDANGNEMVADGVSINEPLNFLRIVAYQKACAEFYSVDTVDDVYSARIWEQNQLALAGFYYNGSNHKLATFLLNGTPYRYDSCAGEYLYNNLQKMFAMGMPLVSTIDTTGYGEIFKAVNYGILAQWLYYNNLFGYQRSLRYQDYFVGSRVRPLAVGDVTVNVSSNKVDVIDVTKKIQVQRFLNQVNRIGRKFSEYMTGIFGGKPMADAHDPIFLGHIVDTIGGSEVQNTGEGQLTTPQSKTSNFRANSNRYAFTVHVGEPCIIIGIATYDIPRAYGSVFERENMHVDRYDAFNPFMQFVGDQPIAMDELLAGNNGTFGYTPRYSEYKQRVSQVAGGFKARQLPGYCKIFDAKYFKEHNTFNINSDFIRSNISDLDEFYLSLTGLSFGSRFHFIVRTDMDVTAHRPMAFNPSIL